ncbi:MAG: hypothetical protein WCA43_23305, partial [Bradyrhizobium sp.]
MSLQIPAPSGDACADELEPVSPAGGGAVDQPAAIAAPKIASGSPAVAKTIQARGKLLTGPV